jgi:protein-S-isoprenylcysteine O-methyltransferase Ste14
VTALVLGLIAIVVLPLIGQDPPQWVFVLGSLSVLAGLATLIWRMRDGPSVDDGPDDGAVV